MKRMRRALVSLALPSGSLGRRSSELASWRRRPLAKSRSFSTSPKVDVGNQNKTTTTTTAAKKTTKTNTTTTKADHASSSVAPTIASNPPQPQRTKSTKSTTAAAAVVEDTHPTAFPVPGCTLVRVETPSGGFVWCFSPATAVLVEHYRQGGSTGLGKGLSHKVLNEMVCLFASQGEMGPLWALLNDQINELATGQSSIGVKLSGRQKDLRKELRRASAKVSLEPSTLFAVLLACIHHEDEHVVCAWYRIFCTHSKYTLHGFLASEAGAGFEQAVTQDFALDAVIKASEVSPATARIVFRDEIQARKHCPTMTQVHTLMRSTVSAKKAQDPQLVVDIFAYMAQVYLSPDEKAYELLVQAFARSGSVEKSTKVFGHLLKTTSFQPSCATYNRLLQLYVKVGDAEGVAGVLKLMAEAGVVEDLETAVVLMATSTASPEEQVAIYHAARQVCFTEGRLPSAGASDVFLAWLDHLLKVGLLEDALGVLEDITTFALPNRSQAYKQFFAGCVGQGAPAEAMRAFAMLERDTSVMMTETVIAPLLQSLVEGDESGDSLREVLGTLQRTCPKLTVTTLTALLRGYASTGQVARAASTLDNFLIKNPARALQGTRTRRDLADALQLLGVHPIYRVRDTHDAVTGDLEECNAALADIRAALEVMRTAQLPSSKQQLHCEVCVLSDLHRLGAPRHRITFQTLKGVYLFAEKAQLKLNGSADISYLTCNVMLDHLLGDMQQETGVTPEATIAESKMGDEVDGDSEALRLNPDSETLAFVASATESIEKWFQVGDWTVRPRLRDCTSFERFAIREALARRFPELHFETLEQEERGEMTDKAEKGDKGTSKVGNVKDMVVLRLPEEQLRSRRALGGLDYLMWLLGSMRKHGVPANMYTWVRALSCLRIARERAVAGDAEVFREMRVKLRGWLVAEEWIFKGRRRDQPALEVLDKLMDLYIYPARHADETTRNWNFHEDDALEAVSLYYALRKKRWEFDEVKMVTGIFVGLRQVLQREGGSEARTRLFDLAMHCLTTMKGAEGEPLVLTSSSFTTLVHLAPERDTVVLGQLLALLQLSRTQMDLGACLALLGAAAGPKDALTMIRYADALEKGGSLRRSLEAHGDDARLMHYFNSLQTISAETDNEPRANDPRFSFRHISQTVLRNSFEDDSTPTPLKKTAPTPTFLDGC